MADLIDISRQAVARGWTHPANAHKEMDIALAEAIADEIAALPAQGVAQIEERKFYHDEWPLAQLLEARDLGNGLLTDDGEAWRYRLTHSDARGKYDVLFRPTRKIAVMPPQGVRVKPLVWTVTQDKRDGRTHYGHGAFDHWYGVHREKAGAWAAFHFLSAKRTGIYPENDDTFPTLDAAKAAAQADYERRILAALAPAEAGGVDNWPSDGTCRMCGCAPIGADGCCNACHDDAPVDALVDRIAKAWPTVRDANGTGGELCAAIDEIDAALAAIREGWG